MSRIAISTAAMMLAVSTAQATTFSGGISSYLVPQSGYYFFEVAGAQGGIGDGGIGGGGAIISGNIYFNQGLNLTILVGGGGGVSFGDSAGGGGGMSFIASGGSPIVVAGGGGGAHWFGGSVGGDASVDQGDGQGGFGRGAGAGFYSDGGAGLGPDYVTGGGGLSSPSWAGGSSNVGYIYGDPIPVGWDFPPYFYTTPGAQGGFGGGGGGGFNDGGGGGGYSGGNVEAGGSSYISPDAFSVVATAGGNKGPFYFLHGILNSTSADGYVNLVLSAIPEPDAWALLILGFGATGFMLRRRKRSEQST